MELKERLNFTRGNKFIFDVSDPSNNNYEFILNSSTDGGGTDYTTRVTRDGTAGTANSTVTLMLIQMYLVQLVIKIL